MRFFLLSVESDPNDFCKCERTQRVARVAGKGLTWLQQDDGILEILHPTRMNKARDLKLPGCPHDSRLSSISSINSN